MKKKTNKIRNQPLFEGLKFYLAVCSSAYSLIITVKCCCANHIVSSYSELICSCLFKTVNAVVESSGIFDFCYLYPISVNILLDYIACGRRVC